MSLYQKLSSNSLPTRAWLVVALIALLAISTASTSAVLAWIAKTDAKAVNTAGTMRMATYRINYLLNNDNQIDRMDETITLDADRPLAPQLIEDMNNKLAVLKQYQAKTSNRDIIIDQQLDSLTAHWQSTLMPAILDNNLSLLSQESAIYVNQVNQLTQLIQERNEKRQHIQQLLQMSALGLIMLMMLFGMRELKHQVLAPIDALMQATKAFRKDKPAQAPLLGYREFQELSRSFNAMTQTISKHKIELESEVAMKTKHLHQVNQAMTLLYNFANQLNHTPVTMPKLYELLSAFSVIMPHIRLSLCIHGEQYWRDDFKPVSQRPAATPFITMSVAHSYPPNESSLNPKDRLTVQTKKTQTIPSITIDQPLADELFHSNVCQTSDCQHCDIKREDSTKIYPIDGTQVQWGELMVQTDATQVDADIQAQQDELLSTLANLISIAFNNQKQRQQEHQLVLLEERNTIARELHDSLAQSLSYLKIQLAMLGKHSQLIQETLANTDVASSPSKAALDEQQAQMAQVLLQARNGLNSAYTQLRELLVTFRLKIDAGGFDAALQQACDEFAKKAGYAVTLNNRMLSLNLTASEQIDLLQITREALSNIHRHAKASRVVVDLYQYQNPKGKQMVQLSIRDDGIGIKLDFDPSQHHGLSIMQERANSIGGEFIVRRAAPKGTEVNVQFLPKFFQT